MDKQLQETKWFLLYWQENPWEKRGVSKCKCYFEDLTTWNSPIRRDHFPTWIKFRNGLFFAFKGTQLTDWKWLSHKYSRADAPDAPSHYGRPSRTLVPTHFHVPNGLVGRFKREVLGAQKQCTHQQADNCKNSSVCHHPLFLLEPRIIFTNINFITPRSTINPFFIGHRPVPNRAVQPQTWMWIKANPLIRVIVRRGCIISQRCSYHFIMAIARRVWIGGITNHMSCPKVFFVICRFLVFGAVNPRTRPPLVIGMGYLETHAIQFVADLRESVWRECVRSGLQPPCFFPLLRGVVLHFMPMACQACTVARITLGIRMVNHGYVCQTKHRANTVT